MDCYDCNNSITWTEHGQNFIDCKKGVLSERNAQNRLVICENHFSKKACSKCGALYYTCNCYADEE